jgi:ubiquinone/menaquinone biosynthesis C-methylase UbiE
METTFDKHFKTVDGIFVSTLSETKFNDFEKQYLNIREKEKRVLTIDEIKQLPFVAKSSSDYGLWKIRRKSIRRVLNYIQKKKKSLKILDIGCGNGFFTNMLSKPNNTVVGVDINLLELKQAAEAFPNKSIIWYYADILNEKLPEQNFDMITFCGSFQYFENPVALLEICKTLLNSSGEIHIIDSPFYTEVNKQSAKKRSLDYFKSMCVEPMSNYYHHHTLNVFDKYNYQFKYKPLRFINKLYRINDSPFPWIIITNL